MFAHLQFQDGTVLYKTEAGKIACEILDLNDHDSIEYRKFIDSTIKISLKRQTEILETIQTITNRMSKGLIETTKGASLIHTLRSDLNRIIRNLQIMTGI